MKKKLSAIVLLFSLGLGLLGASPINAAKTSNNNSYEINLDGAFIPLDVQPFVSHSSLLIPIRTLSPLGLSYSWNAASQTVTIKNPAGDVLTVTLNNKIASKNGKSIEMAVPAQSKNGRVLVPIRFVSESMGYEVQHESIRDIIFVRSPDYASNPGNPDQSDLVAARRAAISLPITTDFKILDFGRTKHYHSYTFPVGRADMYEFFDSYIYTIVKIEDGKAIAIGQYTIGDRSNFSHKAGNITGKNTSDPVLEPLLFGVNFYRHSNTSIIEISYWEDPETEHRSMKSITNSGYKVYSDIIQKVPNDL
ncbi:copper amine oxidase N-terminal domain-containing protein [Paenibacillus sanfengchensis]|uniref:copper amine oxidase N-terminal domain-containing protein n=1 Tax=Paenibacillus sanfengchensis TaxID=3119819 RepID=UPI002FE04B02